MSGTHEDEYDDNLVTLLELVWGAGFLAPGGADNVRQTVAGVDITGSEVLDIGCGIGGADLVLAGELGAHVTAIDIEAPLLARARDHATAAGLAGRIDFHLVEPGALAFADQSFDHVFSSGVLIHVEDKPAMLADILRVLRPGGWLLAYDWMKGTEPYSDDMRHWFRMEGLTYAMDHLGNYRRFLEQAGFVDIGTEDGNAEYLALCRREYAQMQGPLFARMTELLGVDKRDHFIENWRSMVVVLENGELRPGRLRGRRPR